MDCANGASYKVSPKVFEELGAEVIKIGTEPDGYNINQKCGSMHPEVVSKAVIENIDDYEHVVCFLFRSALEVE